MPFVTGKLVDEFSLTPETSDASSFTSSTRSSKSLLRSPHHRHSHERNHDSAVAGLCHFAGEESPNNFGEDGQHNGRLCHNSTGGVAASSRRHKPDSEEGVQTYYPLHQGPPVTVSSADGTTLIADGESTSLRNAAAQSLFRAIERQKACDGIRTLEGHLDKIFGAVDVGVDVRDFATVQDITVVRKQWVANSIHPQVEGKGDGRFKRTAKKVHRKIGAWVHNVFA